MIRKWIVRSVPFAALLVGGLAYGYAAFGGSSGETPETATAPFVCPMTGEELPCPNCCPLKR